LFGGSQRVGQAAQQNTVGDELQQTPVEPHGQAPAGEVVADGELAASEADQAGAVDQPVDLDRVAGNARPASPAGSTAGPRPSSPDPRQRRPDHHRTQSITPQARTRKTLGFRWFGIGRGFGYQGYSGQVGR
jgi:hypothetical protein